MKRIIVDNGDSVSVVIPAPEYVAELVSSGMTEDQAIEHIRQKDAPGGEIVKASALPNDRIFRAAWKKAGSAISVDIGKAKEVAHEMRREVRAEKFKRENLDVEATIPAKAAQAEARRQVIRDADAVVQGNINAAADVDSLKATIMAYRAEVE